MNNSEFIAFLAIALDASDKYTRGHSQRVSGITVLISREFGMEQERIKKIKLAGLVHDIGKITGTSSPTASVQILHGYHIDDEKLLNMVKKHDINLPWYHAHLRGKMPTENDWNKLKKKIDLKLLCIFMIADRVDCPGGWRNNQPLVWFLNEARKRKLVEEPIILEDKTSI